MRIPVQWGTVRGFNNEDYPEGYYDFCSNCGGLVGAECDGNCESIAMPVTVNIR